MKTKQFVTFICFNVFLSVLTLQLQAQTTLHLHKDNKTCLYGYTDSAASWIVPPQFDQAEELDRDYAIVTQNEKSGLINSEGKIIVPLIYSNIKNEFRFYILEKNSSYSIFDYRSGKIVTTDLPYKIKDFYEGNAIVHMGKLYGLYSNEKAVIRDVSYIQFENYNIAKVYLGNAENKQIKLFDLATARYITANTYDLIEIYDSLCFIMQKDNFYGAVNRNEKTIIPFVYDQYQNLSYDGNYSFILTNTAKNRSVLFDKTGKQITKKKYSTINTDERVYSPASFIAGYKNKYTLIDLTGKELVPCIYDTITLLERSNNTFVYILHAAKGFQIANLEGKLLNTGYYPNINFLRNLYAYTPEYYEDGTENYEHELEYTEPLPLLITIHADSSITWLDLLSETEYHFPDTTSTLEDENLSCSGLIYYDGKYGLISPDMEHILLPTYDFIMPFKDERRQTNIIHNDLFGIIDIEGKTIIQPEHTFIEQNPFSEESFIVKNNEDSWGIIGADNETIIPSAYRAITGYNAEMDYFWGIPMDATYWRILDKSGQPKSDLSFISPISLSETDYAVVRVYMNENGNEFHAGVINCQTLEMFIPYKYQEIKKINDSIFMCYENTSTDSPFGCDLYIHNHRIDSVHTITFLPNNILAINQNNHWGYFSGDDWLIPADEKSTKNIKDHIKILNLPFSNEDDFHLEGSGSVSLFMNTSNTSPIQILTNNKALQVYCNTLAEESSDEEDPSSVYPSITVFDNTYISDLMDEKETIEDEEFYNWSGYNSSSYATTDIKSVVLAESLSEVRYFYNREDRYGNYIDRIDTTYTIKNNVLVPVSLGDITNHIKSNSMLSNLLLVQLDSLRDIQLPCTDRGNIVELADAWQLEKDGIHFFYTDERDLDSYEYDEIEVILLYSDLVKQFKNSPYLKELYENSLKQ